MRLPLLLLLVRAVAAVWVVAAVTRVIHGRVDPVAKALAVTPVALLLVAASYVLPTLG